SINVEAKAFNQVLKASAKISVYEMRGILGESTGHIVYELGSPESDGKEEGYYSEGYSTFTMTHIGSMTAITLFGYKSIEDARNANIKVTYTPAYNGNIQKITHCWNYEARGNGKKPFLSNYFGIGLFQQDQCVYLSKQNNGIYKFEDLNNKYIKPTYLHLKLP
ncbi:hypothetical protein L8W55_07895, partial [Campylobacter sp. FU_520]|uniref:hypothetical protein n=1 Tax=Campylobacter sp. FU_520 TaxID=2911611 RepID=UPI0021E67853